ncbi:MAG: stage V sporulation protein AB [Acetivibrio ethanolgignens]
MLVKNVLLFLIAAAGGGVVSGGVFALISLIGVFPQLASRTATATHIAAYESCIIWGGIAGNVISVFEWGIPGGKPILLVFGLFCGIYIGCFAMALAEILKVIPIFTERARLVQGIPYIVLAIAAGKALGSYYQMFWP